MTVNFGQFLSRDGVAIFLLHGVIDEYGTGIRNYTRKHINKSTFLQFLKQINPFGYPLSMDQVYEHLKNSEPFPPYSYAITFDDGFENNLSIAIPMLHEFKIPATIYITTRFIDENAMSWIDKIEFALEKSSATKIKPTWCENEFSLSSDDQKIVFLKEIRNYVKHNSSINSEQFSLQICDQLNFKGEFSSNDPIDLKLNWEQVREIRKSELFSVGGHGHSHAILSFLNSEQLRNELDTSMMLLQEKGGGPTIHYSYPEGLEHCISKELVAALKARNILCCPTAIVGINKIVDDPFYLKRIMV